MRPLRRRRCPAPRSRPVSTAGLAVLAAIGLGMLGAWESGFPLLRLVSLSSGSSPPVRVELLRETGRERSAAAYHSAWYGVVLAGSRTVAGIATYYGVEDGYVDGITYCGGAFSPADGTTAAVRPGRYPCGTRLLVIERTSQRSIEVVVKDHCGSCGWNHLDLGRGAFSRLAPVEQGRLEVVWVPLRE